ncbi:MAG: DNA polymerase III subunit delta' [Acidimicrobiia bacterium]|nr:DNA polymerase III subunit delta' [Acidimicrobiia bacterium]
MGSSDSDSIPPPRANPDLVGHGAAEALLKEAFARGRLAHAWLIAGPRGVGKATLAYRFARYVLASRAGESPRALHNGKASAPEPPLFGAPETKPAPKSEGEGLYLDPADPVFRRVAAGGHADFLAVEPAFDDKKGARRTEIVVEDVRGVGAFLALTPAEGGWRVVVVDSADDMNRNAANAILKVLEEPPARALLLLVSHNPGALLPTIRSRCRRLSLRALAEADAARVIGGLMPSLGRDEALELARLAQGSPGRSLELASEDGLALQRELGGLLDALPDLDGIALHRFGDKVAKSGAEAAFRIATDILCRRLDGFAVGDPGRWLATRDRVVEMLARVEPLNLDRKAAMLDAVFLARDAAR